MENHFLQGIDTVILRVSDIEKAKSWYTEKLGFKNVHEDKKLKLVVLDTFSPTSLTIWETQEKIVLNPNTASYPIFRTLDAHLAHQRLKLNGITVGEIITDHVVTYFTIHDTDGNILEVCQVHN
ncbi:Glyoxalase/bleomycin resistance protein/dioxygenase [Allomuricauda ruestringensis DSM 13258]|uniref:Glyoxalase/bleomycin resistance protein/dioxygenase n=1 Tax=Allomuricauda ruestringensis (strain DSM 13258 / CIP 107369 / LMG 19739 / B1) TaxID=886377 RepID=G2PRH5_ALLRU|nr:VOC family protein [Allomuricauda ruestringensis]AEM69424.1 Glyoxalase/bleomycin resistance protein/dioxygenase [Allomuricauda ruestringensis DSM 13258]